MTPKAGHERPGGSTFGLPGQGHALSNPQALQAMLLHSTDVLGIATDVAGTIRFFNVGAERMLGYAAGDVVDRRALTELHLENELAQRAADVGRATSTTVEPGFGALVGAASRQAEDTFEATYVCADGRHLSANTTVAALRDPENAVAGYLFVGASQAGDASAANAGRPADQQFRDEHEYLRSLVEFSVNALWVTDADGWITDVNRQTEELTGRARHELIGTPFASYFSDPDRARAYLEEAIAEGRLERAPLEVRVDGRTPTMVTYTAATYYDRHGAFQGVFGSTRDTTELNRYERELERKNVELVAADHMKSEFLANMSHELRTPLNAILGFSEVLKDGLAGELNKQQAEFATDIYTSGSHLLSLINDILDLSKIEAGKMELDLEPVHLPALVYNSLSIIKEKAASRRVRLDAEVDDDLDPMQVDSRKVKQILYNMLSNAMKFTSEGGHVVVGVERVPRRNVGQLDDARPGRTLPLTGEGFAEYVRIRVSDDGIGIAEAALERLFQPFGQIDSGLSRGYEGSGLGLALIKLLAELHGGTVAVESAEGEGSRFTVWLPMRPVDTAHTERSRGVSVGRGEAHGSTAMIVEDDFKSAELIRFQLESEGFQVLHAASGEAGLALALQQPLALITVDIMLPNMDGWEFLSRLKRIPQFQHVPVVMISILEDRTRGISLGAAGVLQKPITRQDLYDALDQLNVLPSAPEQTLTMLAVDDDPKAVELVATRMAGIATNVLRAYGGQEAIEIAQRERPDVIVLDLMMPRVNGFEVAAALSEDARTADIPILVVTAKELTSEDRDRLHEHVFAIMDKVDFATARLTTEIRRALAGRT